MVRSGGLRPFEGVHFFFDPQQLLHMMADLVRDDVCLLELAWRSKPFPQFFKKPEVQINLFILRTVEGASSGLGLPTARSSLVAEENQLGMAIARAGLWKQ